MGFHQQTQRTPMTNFYPGSCGLSLCWVKWACHEVSLAQDENVELGARADVDAESLASIAGRFRFERICLTVKLRCQCRWNLQDWRKFKANMSIEWSKTCGVLIWRAQSGCSSSQICAWFVSWELWFHLVGVSTDGLKPLSSMAPQSTKQRSARCVFLPVPWMPTWATWRADAPTSWSWPWSLVPRWRCFGSEAENHRWIFFAKVTWFRQWKIRESVCTELHW